MRKTFKQTDSTRVKTDDDKQSSIDSKRRRDDASKAFKTSEAIDSLEQSIFTNEASSLLQFKKTIKPFDHAGNFLLKPASAADNTIKTNESFNQIDTDKLKLKLNEPEASVDTYEEAHKRELKSKLNDLAENEKKLQ